MNATHSSPNGAEDANRRKSGRAVHKPHIFGDEVHAGSILSNGPAKRKRVPEAQAAHDGDENEMPEDDSDEEDSEGEPDEEELREKRKPEKRKALVAKPATKRAKTANGASTTLTIRPAAKAAKLEKARSRPSQAHKQTLYANVFGHGNSAEEAANIWLSALKKDSVVALRDLVNFVLECIGCDVRIESSDIEDIDNVANRLGEVLEEYAQNKAAEYPLISKAKQYSEFRTALVEFFEAVIKVLHTSSIFYDQQEVYDNIHVWIATMAGAQYRPFRHTATLVSLSMATALCRVAQELQGSLADDKTLLETSKKKKNKGRVSDLQKSMKVDEKRLEVVDTQLKDVFDTVYVHRYRDVDEKIRVECVAALGNWIVLYRNMFLEGQFLRYLGWVMSDSHANTRLEVIKQLDTLFKDKRNVAALRAFTDRFRPRMVEMGARDADVSVRVASIELLDRLRNYELLEPDDIDTVGRLIFDIEPRVRKAVAKFFVANIKDLYRASVDDMDQEQYDAALPKGDTSENFMNATQSWIRFKCLTETFGSYDKDSESADGTDNTHGLFRSDESESRYMLATQSIFPYMADLRRWESLAGYLLYDHSSITADADDVDINLAVQGAYKLNTGEEAVLLDVLYSSAKLYLQSVLHLQVEKKGRKVPATAEEIRTKQETAAHHLSVIVPQLLSRYGSTPQAAASILRLQQLLDANLINEAQSGEAPYSALLEDINKQFATHSDRKVLAEASKAFRTARTFDQSKEAADAKVQEIWSDASATIQTLLNGKNVDTRGTLDRTVLSALVDTTVRLANLASVCDCTEWLEAKLTSKKQRGKSARQENLLDLMIALVKRGEPDEDTTAHFVEMEDQVCIAVVTVLSFYFRWKVVGLKNSIAKKDSRHLSTGALVDLAMHRSSFVETLAPIIQARLPLDPVRITCILTLLDLFTLFATVRHMRPTKGSLDEDVKTNLASLTTEVPEEVLRDIMATHEKMEKSLAKKSHRKIDSAAALKKQKGAIDANTAAEEADEDVAKPPEDSDDEANDSDNESSGDDGEENVEIGGRNAKKQAALLAEQQLCELASKIVLASIASAVDTKVKARLQLNRSKLGKSYMQVIAYLDDKKDKKTSSAISKNATVTMTTANPTPKQQSAKSKTNETQQQQSDRMELEEDVIEDDNQEESEAEEEGEGDGEEEALDEEDDDANADEIVDDEMMGD